MPFDFVGRFCCLGSCDSYSVRTHRLFGASLVVWVPLIDNLLVFIVLVWRFGYLGCSDSHLVHTARFCADLVLWVPLISSSVCTTSFSIAGLHGLGSSYSYPFRTPRFIVTFFGLGSSESYPV